MPRALVAACLLLAACELPPLQLRFALTDGESQQCIANSGGNKTTDCSEVMMLCEAVLSVRIVPPGDPTVPYVTMCEPLLGGGGTLCSIANPDLPMATVPIPEQVLEVQMAVFPRSAVPTDPLTGELVCPRVEFAANNLPVLALPACNDPDPLNCPKVPAVGGRTFYRPGDTETVVDLGCSDLDQLTNELTCEGIRRISVTSTVSNFDDLVSSVGDALAERLTVDIGEPEPADDTYILPPRNSRELILSTMAGDPSWSLELTDLVFNNFVCLEVLEDGAQSTTSVTCRTAMPEADTIDMAGVYLDKDTLNQILGALNLAAFPDEGLVVGMVVDEFFNPLPNVAVSCNGCSIEYLSANRNTTVTGATSSSGIFVSRTRTIAPNVVVPGAPFGTGFTIPSTVLRPELGGLIEGKATIVVIQDKLPIGP